jgi:hypothetical protein
MKKQAKNGRKVKGNAFTLRPFFLATGKFKTIFAQCKYEK